MIVSALLSHGATGPVTVAPSSGRTSIIRPQERIVSVWTDTIVDVVNADEALRTSVEEINYRARGLCRPECVNDVVPKMDALRMATNRFRSEFKGDVPSLIASVDLMNAAFELGIALSKRS